MFLHMNSNDATLLGTIDRLLCCSGNKEFVSVCHDVCVGGQYHVKCIALCNPSPSCDDRDQFEDILSSVVDVLSVQVYSGALYRCTFQVFFPTQGTKCHGYTKEFVIEHVEERDTFHDIGDVFCSNKDAGRLKGVSIKQYNYVVSAHGNVIQTVRL